MIPRGHPPSEGIYRRVTMRMYGDEKFMRLSPLRPSGQALWLYLLTGPHTNQIPGVFVIGRAAIAEALDWDLEAFEKAFAEVIGEGLVEFDAKTRLWFVPNAVHHNMPPNPNVVKSWRSHWMLLPECELRNRIFTQLLHALTERSDAFGEAFAESCGNAFEKASREASGKALGKALPHGMAKQDQDQDQEQETKPTASSARPPISCPCESIVAIYHEKLPSLPAVKLMQEGRKKAIRGRWGWVLSTRKSNGEPRAQTAEQALEWFGDYFARANDNDFLMGRTERSGSHGSWRCDLDFLLSDKGMKQVIEKTEAIAK